MFRLFHGWHCEKKTFSEYCWTAELQADWHFQAKPSGWGEGWQKACALEHSWWQCLAYSLMKKWQNVLLLLLHKHALQAAGGTIPKVAVLTKKTARALPRKTLASHLQEKIACQKYPLEQKVNLKINKSQEAGHSLHKSAQFSWWLPTSMQLWINHTRISSDKDQRLTSMPVWLELALFTNLSIF